jgi:hypothetical protein
MLDRRGRLLLATVSAAALPLLDEPAVRALHGWLDTWRGIGHLEAGDVPVYRITQRDIRAASTAAVLARNRYEKGK